MPKTPFLSRVLNRGNKIDANLLHSFLEELAEERDFLELIFDSMVEGVVAFDEVGNILFLNSTASRLLSIPKNEGLGQNFEDFLIDSHLQEVVLQTLETNNRVLHQEIEIRTPHERILDISLIPLIDKREKYGGTILLFYDISGRKKDESKLRHAQKLASLTTLAAGMAHEIRNPLNALSIHLEILNRQVKTIQDPEGDIQDSLGVIREEIQRLNQVVENFLSVVRPDSTNRKEKEIKELVEETLNLLGPEIKENQIQLDFSAPQEPIIILGETTQIRSAFTNLIRNAVEAMEPGGKIFITILKKGDQVQIEFKDEGKGIDADSLENIFEPYYTTKPEGTGLGLMLVEKVIRGHGGTITVKSELNKGTVFTVTLPIAPRQQPLLLEK